ncbi:hypothetical protein [Moorena sp. SIO4G3]|uniref:hypothetical protein n=1 Tax=Moorena sp. SIO4G3 TaxID=2607821 RepID=UPI00142BE256|nr:hypothetical protein [Moorena sp. SIO4G3]NEO82152.1 hypothetical protein [Moorena sp. SIO4G3]
MTKFRYYSQRRLTKESGFDPHFSESDSRGISTTPTKLYSRFPIPDSRFPIPDSRFPIPDSRFPIPDSRFPTPSKSQALK